MIAGSSRLGLVLIAAAFFFSGCTTTRMLMPTPNIYVASETDPFVEVPQALRGTEVDVLYATASRSKI